MSLSQLVKSFISNQKIVSSHSYPHMLLYLKNIYISVLRFILIFTLSPHICSRVHFIFSLLNYNFHSSTLLRLIFILKLNFFFGEISLSSITLICIIYLFFQIYHMSNFFFNVFYMLHLNLILIMLFL